MKRLLLAAAFALASVTAQAGPIINVIGYETPDPASFGVLTTDGYSYYTGPIILDLADGTKIAVYCADLDHTLHAGLYEFSVLTTDGRGNPISAAISHKLGAIAGLGLAALAASDFDRATAAQAAIWDDEYGITSSGSPGPLALIDVLNLATTSFGDGSRAIALIPYGEGWYGDATASQQMIVGLAVETPEPGTLGLLAISFGALAFLRRRA